MERRLKVGYGGDLRDSRKKSNLSLRSFAKIVGIHPTYLSKIELGQMPPPSTAVREKIDREITRLLKENLRDRRALLERTKIDVFNLELEVIKRISQEHASQPELRKRMIQHLRSCADRLQGMP